MIDLKEFKKYISNARVGDIIHYRKGYDDGPVLESVITSIKECYNKDCSYDGGCKHCGRSIIIKNDRFRDCYISNVGDIRLVKIINTDFISEDEFSI